jgi:hypothetical protein
VIEPQKRYPAQACKRAAISLVDCTSPKVGRDTGDDDGIDPADEDVQSEQWHEHADREDQALQPKRLRCSVIRVRSHARLLTMLLKPAAFIREVSHLTLLALDNMTLQKMITTQSC